VAHYVDSQVFQTLLADAAAVRAQLHMIHYTVHIQGLRVHVEKFDGQTDYSARVIDTFERFAIEASKDYPVPPKGYADMNHVEEQILVCVAKPALRRTRDRPV
jgi:DNA mismatch repair protein MutS